MRHEVTLQHGAITLRPLRVDDAPAFRHLVDEDSWAGMSTPLPKTDQDMAAHLAPMLDNPTMLPFAVEKSAELVGRTVLYDLVPGLRVEIGHTIYTRQVWGTEVNPTAKLLLLDYAFDELALHRVPLRCDSRNTRSHHAILRLGATYEGTLRKFRNAADGTIADADYFSIIRDEWPRIRPGIAARAGA